jgi:Zn-dependent peptidase ImmA (M78 family)
MSNYLDHTVVTAINRCVAKTLDEVSIKEPPVSYDVLYESEKLIRHTLSTEEFAGEHLVTKPDLKNVRGLLLVKDKRVFVVDDTAYEKRNNFVYAHELGHWKLPHHKELLFKCTQFDLSAQARKQLEREANHFAGELGFMGRVFFEYLQSSTLSLQTIKDLSDKFNMSIEATFRKAVEIETRPCAFVSLTLNKDDDDKFLAVRYLIQSPAFVEKVGKLDHRSTFPRNHVLSQIITDPISSALGEYECNLKFGPEEKSLRAEVWRNPWNIFVLVQPS